MGGMAEQVVMIGLEEQWRGAESVPRILELRAIGLTWGAIAKRFGVTRGTIYKYTNRNPPSQSTGTAGSTNPGGSALSVTDDGSKVPDSSPDKATHGGSQ